MDAQNPYQTPEASPEAGPFHVPTLPDHTNLIRAFWAFISTEALIPAALFITVLLSEGGITEFVDGEPKWWFVLGGLVKTLALFFSLKYAALALGGLHRPLLLGTGTLYVLASVLTVSSLAPDFLFAAAPSLTLGFRVLMMAAVTLLCHRHLSRTWTTVGALAIVLQTGLQVGVEAVGAYYFQTGFESTRAIDMKRVSLIISLIQLLSTGMTWTCFARLALLRRRPIKTPTP